MHTGKQKQMNASYQASLVNRHIRRFTGLYHMSLDRTNMDSIDRPNFDLLKWFFDSSSDEEKMTKSRISLKQPGQIVTSECGISSAID